MDTHELAWAAGFFDGEGCTTRRNGRNVPRMSVGQMHREPLDRLVAATGGLGKVYGPYASQFGMYRWEVGTHERVQAVAAMLWPWLGTVKRAQAAAALKDERREH